MEFQYGSLSELTPLSSALEGALPRTQQPKEIEDDTPFEFQAIEGVTLKIAVSCLPRSQGLARLTISPHLTRQRLHFQHW